MQAKFNIFHLLLNKDKAIRIVQLKVFFRELAILCCADNAVMRLKSLEENTKTNIPFNVQSNSQIKKNMSGWS